MFALNIGPQNFGPIIANYSSRITELRYIAD